MFIAEIGEMKKDNESILKICTCDGVKKIINRIIPDWDSNPERK